ncbi:rho-related GTP-binding protein RhoN [Alosa sapidissima]|uniref:rho-related GTP-binding protein RhoN n=1 Tax=Alosa sapidissima TaxID=34773 RepID=UPI001C09E539|nr:rho-related GTP-binding protein RhoN [Alosa sapidissima]
MASQGSRCKIVVVGDTQCGKTALLHVFAKDCYPENYVPTVFENYTASFEIDKQRIELNMWDTSVSTYVQWQAETQEFCPSAKLVLVGCKLDMRTDVSTLRELSKQRLIPVTHEQGSTLARQLGAVAYVECSSRVCENSVRDVFHITTLATVRRAHAHPGSSGSSSGALKRSTSRRALKRISQLPLPLSGSASQTHEPAPTLRKDRAKSCVLM